MHSGTNNSCPTHYIKCTWLMSQIFLLLLLSLYQRCCLSSSSFVFSVFLSRWDFLLFCPLSFILLPSLLGLLHPPPRHSQLPRWHLHSFCLSVHPAPVHDACFSDPPLIGLIFPLFPPHCYNSMLFSVIFAFFCEVFEEWVVFFSVTLFSKLISIYSSWYLSLFLFTPLLASTA